jgi:hypothetical protein
VAYVGPAICSEWRTVEFVDVFRLDNAEENPAIVLETAQFHRVSLRRRVEQNRYRSGTEIS